MQVKLRNHGDSPIAELSLLGPECHRDVNLPPHLAGIQHLRDARLMVGMAIDTAFDTPMGSCPRFFEKRLKSSSVS